MRIVRITLLGVLLLSFASSMAWGQAAPPSVDVFAEGGGSILSNGALGASVTLIFCSAVHTTPADFRMGHVSLPARDSASRRMTLSRRAILIAPIHFHCFSPTALISFPSITSAISTSARLSSPSPRPAWGLIVSAGLRPRVCLHTTVFASPGILEPGRISS